MSRLPKYIALCGWPKSGKDEVAKIFAELLNARVVDDGEPLRSAAPHLFDFDPELPYTQEGKSTLVDTPHGKHTVRYILGELGKYLERNYSSDFMMWRALRDCDGDTEHKHFIFPSLRRSAASALIGKDHMVIEVKRPGYNSSPHDFDWYDPTFVTDELFNCGTLEDLRNGVKLIIERHQ